MFLDDKVLQDIVGIKKYSPYRDDEDKVNVHGVINMKRKYKEELKKGKWQLEEELKLSIQLQKDKLLQKGANSK